ncbi:MAG: ATP-binding protein [Coleofasciculaceae cyanobacterium RL_1_1]|nr:ATP-binding protein [Coleofasciculaceae cyanobacterium RL_1_1]
MDWRPTPRHPRPPPRTARHLPRHQRRQRSQHPLSPSRTAQNSDRQTPTTARQRKKLAQRDRTQFAPGLDNWRSILKQTRETWHDEAKRTGEIPAVYIVGNSLDPTRSAGRFKGRQDIFNEIEAIALSDNPPALLLYGERRTGKTSTLKYLPDRVGSDLIPLRVNAQQFAETTTLYGIASSFYDQITESARTARNLSLPSLDRDEIKLDPLAALRQWFDAIGQQHRSKKLLLCIDEFERFDEFISSAPNPRPAALPA